ncbi:DNA cytosine methyltransferase [Streptomyces sp. MST-110588]|uniref:DNA cytosine methyltransferase n=1 Tax=Streptomyces sp. MST-110588 TaxID=2833628 RepID=UPI001F5D4E86|nr:DNA cytosine methyltransferase [Streptomyces sp. MST-110588]UNO41195.1 DNA cytosine methyltransferase [Streptomyces sp. MST-110588]
MSASRNPRTINVVDLFSGCGGFTQGFHEFRPLGVTEPVFRTAAAVEHDIAAASTYALNFADEAGGVEHIHAGDIEDWEPDSKEVQAEVILGGPPCQGFSGLGKEDENDPRNKLWREYTRIVNAIKPKLFIVENVDRFLRSPEFALLHAATEKPDGELRDYVLAQHSVLNSADYGVPQARRRAIVVAVRRDLKHLANMQYPKPTHAKNGLEFLPGSEQQSWVGVGPSVFAHTPEETLTTELPEGKCDPLGVTLPGAFKTTDLHFGRNPTPLSKRRYEAIPEGGNRHDLPPALSTEKWLAHKTGSHDVMGRLYWDRPSVTIRTEFYKPEKGRYLHPRAHRPITHYEAALIQGFPKDFKWSGSKIQIGRQIGNAVPVGLSKALAGMVYEALRS